MASRRRASPPSKQNGHQPRLGPLTLASLLLVALVSCVATWARGSVEVRPDETHDFCCFDLDDIQLARVGHDPPGQLILTVQNFLCEDTLQQLLDEAAAASPLFVDSLTTFPGQVHAALSLCPTIPRPASRGRDAPWEP